MPGNRKTPANTGVFLTIKMVGHPGQNEEILSAIVSPLARPSPLAPPLRCPPLRGFPPYARRCRAATLTLAPLRFARG